MDALSSYMGTILAVITGVGLSAACGFRIFVPLLILNLAAMFGYVHLSPGFEWIAGHYATIAFASATVLEIVAYYVPWLDNVMDAIASPVSILAGAMITASVAYDLPPALRWILAIIAGGGAAGLLHGLGAVMRLKSSLFTGGLANFVIATLELIGSLVLSLLAVLLPFLGLIAAAALIVYYLTRGRRPVRGR